MNRLAGMILVAALLVPAAAEAQRRTNSGCCRVNPFSFTPYAGAFKDAYDGEADGSDLGWMLGFRAGYHESERTTFHLNLGYAQANDVLTPSPFGDPPVYNNQWILLTAGGDFALVPGPTSIAIGADVGVAWRNTEHDGDEGGFRPGDEANEGWGTYELVAPSLTLRHAFSQRTSLSLTLQDYILDVLEGPVEHSPAITLGLSFR